MRNIRFQQLLAAQPDHLQEWGQRVVVFAALLFFVVVGAFALALGDLIAARDTLQLKVGDVATRDILAPRSLTYDSEVLTEQARQAAIAKVEPVYDPNPDVTREQIKLARAVITYIDEVRHDSYADIGQKLEDLLLIEALNVADNIWEEVVTTPDSRWDLIGDEISALVERTMQRDIRADNLDATRSALVNSVASRFSTNEAEVIVAISEDLIQPNTFFNEDLTRERQEEAAAAVAVQKRNFERGQLIIRSGNIVTELDREALRQFGFLQAGDLQLQTLLGALLAMTLVTITFGLYLERFHQPLLRDPTLLSLIGSVFLIALGSVNFFGQEGADQPYLYPSAAMGLLLTSIVSPQLAIVACTFLALLAGITFPNDQALEMTAYILVGSVIGVLAMRRAERLNSFFVAGLIIGLGNLVVVCAFALTAEDTPSLGQLIARGFVAVGNGLFAAGLALVGLYAVTSFFNLPTSLKLIELTDFKQPLLQQLLRKAPGTYQHSLQVANLCELAAEAIGADTQLVRVAAMYHDIGKMLNPYFFAENIPQGANPHDDLNDPYQSARVIIGHVIEGERMARRANLPARIQDFIVEHHGTTQVLYFYNQAIERNGGNASKVDIADFTYPGPAPRSRETAIMMLADGCESATRSRNPSSKADVEEMVNTIFELRLSEGQLDNSQLTLNDLKTIRAIFIETLQAMYHPRIAYKVSQKPIEDRNPQITNGIVKHLEGGEADKTRTMISPKVQLTEVLDIFGDDDPPSPKDADGETPPEAKVPLSSNVSQNQTEKKTAEKEK